MKHIITVVGIVCVSFCFAQNGNTTNTLEFGLFLQSGSKIPVFDIFSKCLKNSITNFEIGVPIHEPFVPGNYLWATVDSTIISAFNASIQTGVNAQLCLAVAVVEMPGWCWALNYGVQDSLDFSSYENMDIYIEYFGLLAERYKTGGVLAQREGWANWGVNRYNSFGESDLSWHPNGYNSLLNPPFYKIGVDEMRVPELAEAYKDTRQEILSKDPTAEIALSFMCQPYQESWPYCQFFFGGLAVGEFEPYMLLLYQQFSIDRGYDRYPDMIDWHGYPHYNDPLRFGGDGLWNDGIDEINWWFKDASLSERANLHDEILDSFGYDDCELVVNESGATPFWWEIQEVYRTGDNEVIGHIAFMLSMLAEMAANDRTSLLQFDTDIDEVTCRYTPNGYTMDDWWNTTQEPIDTVFYAYSRMASLLTGKCFTEKKEIPCEGIIGQTVAVHSFQDPQTHLNVYQLRTTLPTLPSQSYMVRVPVFTRHVNIIPSIGESYLYDCGPFIPYQVITDISWQVKWIEELATGLANTESGNTCISLNGNNPITEESIQILISGSSSLKGIVSIYDLCGRIVLRIPYQTEQDGNSSCTWKVSDFSSGIYFIQDNGSGSGSGNFVGVTVLR